MILKTQHGGYAVELDDATGIYKVLDDNGDVLKETKSKDVLDKFCTEGSQEKIKKKKYPRIPILKKVRRDDDVLVGFATTPAVQSKYGSQEQAWTVIGKKRAKKDCNFLFLDTLTNRQLLAEIEAINKQIKQLNKQKDRIYQSLVRLTNAMFETDPEKTKED